MRVFVDVVYEIQTLLNVASIVSKIMNVMYTHCIWVYHECFTFVVSRRGGDINKI